VSFQAGTRIGEDVQTKAPQKHFAILIWFRIRVSCESHNDIQSGCPRHNNKGTIVNKLEIFVCTAGGPTPKRLQLDSEGTVADLLKAALPDGEIKPGEEILVFLEDQDEPLHHSRKLGECGIGEKTFLHCHRCRHVSVTVNYNGAKEKKFPPSATVARVLRWALNEFGLKGQDAEDKVLRADAKGQPLEPDTHIGSLVTHSCSLTLYLTPLVLVEG
jgi:hypothetical protein